MTGLMIVGAGGHGKVVAEAAFLMNKWSVIAFWDSGLDLPSAVGLPIFKSESDCGYFLGENYQAIVAIGKASTRLLVMDELQKQGVEIVSVVHADAWVSPSVIMAEGCFISAKAAINAETKLERGCIINTGATVDHDCDLGQGVHICPGTNLAGGVRVGDRSWIGIGASVIQGIEIGQQVMVGAGAVVVSNVADGWQVTGCPAKGAKKNE
jgi:sugar O-acyltransferase (sialic acid O-acetyltransferase NeuD family)